MGCPITRRDFLGTTLLGAGAALLDLPPPLRRMLRGEDPPPLSGSFPGSGEQDYDSWTGYPGVGQYARSNGNTWDVVTAGHRIRDGVSGDRALEPAATGETYDVVVVGGGVSGLAAAHRVKRESGGRLRCLVLDNHAVFGGESKRNVLEIDGQRLIAPQGANQFGYPDDPGVGRTICEDARVPTMDERRYQQWAPGVEPLEISTENWNYMLWNDLSPAMGHFFSGEGSGEGRWVRNMWAGDLREAPYPEDVRRDLLRWRRGMEKPRDFGEEDSLERWLDTMTYREYLEGELGLAPTVTRYADPILASYLGLGCDALSAYVAYDTGMPGFQMYTGAPEKRRMTEIDIDAFPGGNGAVARAMVKYLVPDAIEGDESFEDVHNGRLRFDALDRPGQPVRIRLGATVVRVEHDGPPGSAGGARVTYTVDGEAHTLRARSVVMACNGWTARHLVRGLPEEHRRAYAELPRSPALVANVGLRNWRPMYDAGYTAFEWFDGFGFAANLRRSMVVGDYAPPLDPDGPTVLTLYVPLFAPGLPAEEQGAKARREMFGTSYRGYERRIRKQLVRLFGGWDFRPERDIAAIVLNRWGHAYVNPTPGFYFGRDGDPPPPEVIRRPFGRVSFAGAELNGHQHAGAAMREGWRAAGQSLEAL